MSDYSDDTGNIPHKVRLREMSVTGKNRSVAFDVAPVISETGTVAYKQIDPVHAPGSIMTFVNTPSRTWSISGIQLVARSREEASKNLARMNLLRSWRYPVFGISASPDVLGAPPPILLFSAYNAKGRQSQGNILNIPTVMTSLNITWPNDCDYILSADPNDDDANIQTTRLWDHIPPGTPCPIIFTIDISLTETHAPTEYSRFSIEDFRNANLRGF